MANATTDTPLVSVVTVTFNSGDHIRECMASVARTCKGMAIEHVIVDNDSRDETCEIVQREFPEAVLIANDSNIGLTAANNQGQEASSGAYVVFLNPDTVVHEDAFSAMVGVMDENPDIGVLAPRLLDDNGDFWIGIMGNKAPTAWTLINSFMLLNRLSPRLFPGVLRSTDPKGLVDCDWACGACLMVRREVADQFAWGQFGSGDDFDYCIHIREAGWRVVLMGDADVTHFCGRSLKLQKASLWEGTASNFAHYLYERRGPLHTAVGIAGMRLGLRLRGTAHHILYFLTRDPERLYKVNKTRQFLSHDDYSVFRKNRVSIPESYPS